MRKSLKWALWERRSLGVEARNLFQLSVFSNSFVVSSPCLFWMTSWPLCLCIYFRKFIPHRSLSCRLFGMLFFPPWVIFLKSFCEMNIFRWGFYAAVQKQTNQVSIFQGTCWGKAKFSSASCSLSLFLQWGAQSPPEAAILICWKALSGTIQSLLELEVRSVMERSSKRVCLVPLMPQTLPPSLSSLLWTENIQTFADLVWALLVL